LRQFVEGIENRVVESCCADLLREAADYRTELIFLSPGVEARGASPGASAEAQNENLQMLID
jgi:hypothetical protein